jgi:hypothetical protein
MKTLREQTDHAVEGRSNKTAQKIIIQNRVAALRPQTPAAPGAARIVNVTVVYEDAAARDWAKGACEEMFAGASVKEVQSTWWKLDGLSDPAVLAGAVSKAMRADVIMVAIRATEGFPLPFYVWVGSWLLHRLRGKGELVALVAPPKARGFYRNRALEYLRAVAQRAGMPFLLKEPNLAFVARDDSEEES